MDQDSYRKLISGADKGFINSMILFLLRFVSLGYGLAVRLRNFAFDTGLLRTNRVNAVVISIGNLTTGGTGKTPLVVWLCRMLGERGKKCCILTRGYKTEEGKLTDEPAILAKSCPGAELLVNSNRTESARKAIQDFGGQVLVLDDGFQHRHLGRDLDIVAIDATCPFGYGKMLPAGMLREPISSIKRADAVIITRYDQVSDRDSSELEKQIKAINPDVMIARAVHTHPYAKLVKGKEIGIVELKGRKVFAFCGIGNPGAFINRLGEYGMDLVGQRIFNDHHDFSAQDVEDIYTQAEELGAEMILSTQKDWVKTALLKHSEHEISFGYLALELEFVSGLDKIEQLVDKVIISHN